VQRPDDKIEVISTRLKAYDDATSPLKNFYSTRNLFVEVNGVGSSEEVFKNLKQYLT
jgi:adenylate kinase